MANDTLEKKTIRVEEDVLKDIGVTIEHHNLPPDNFNAYVNFLIKRDVKEVRKLTH